MRLLLLLFRLAEPKLDLNRLQTTRAHNKEEDEKLTRARERESERREREEREEREKRDEPWELWKFEEWL
jgi:hypothetical protein